MRTLHLEYEVNYEDMLQLEYGVEYEDIATGIWGGI